MSGSVNGSGGDTLTIVLGPRTALGRAWLAGDGGSGTVLIARNVAERAELAGAHPGQRLWTPEALDTAALAACHRLHILGFALGPIHPEIPDWARVEAAAHRDLAVVRDLLGGAEKAQAHLLFVSSILAQAPRGTAWYGGWKNVLEGALSQLASEHPRCVFSVVFPGRLCQARAEALPFSLLSTPVRSLVGYCSTIVGGGRPVRRIVGLDARLWLAVRGAVSLPRAVFGRI